MQCNAFLRPVRVGVGGKVLHGQLGQFSPEPFDFLAELLDCHIPLGYGSFEAGSISLRNHMRMERGVALGLHRGQHVLQSSNLRVHSMFPKIGVFAHMFHSALFDEVRRYLLNIPHGCDLHLSTCSEENAHTLRRLFAGWPGAVDVRVVENRGRDIAPKLITFATEHAGYDYVLHVHTKGSMPSWRMFILDRLIGSEEQVTHILRRFDEDASLGILGPEYWPAIVPHIVWSKNRKIADGLLDRMEIDPLDVLGLEFPAGSMFWARPAALQPLFDLRLSVSDFPEEPIGRDGTLAHAIERLFYISTEAADLRWDIATLPDATNALPVPRRLYHRSPDAYRHYRLNRAIQA